MEILLRYLHFISIFLIFATLTAEHLLLKKELSRSEIARLARIDGLYGFAALLLLGAGFTLWLGGYGKPAEFYTLNWIFHTKLALFFLVGILSIYPTVFFLRNRKGDPAQMVKVRPLFFWLIRTELFLLLVLPLLAGLMARGAGYTGP